MPFVYYFAPKSLSPAQYDDIQKGLAAAGAATPAGRTYHCAFAAGPNLHVLDVWDSTEAFDSFGATLMPILNELGIDPGQPLVTPVHNIIIG
ncbi:MAG TPA: hypothetical protein VMZ00_14150 [Sporichthya sp.]|nr:hypothetical protein [Sporichthya sp.]